jgi:uncharacterized coiled-coil protein SlyX
MNNERENMLYTVLISLIILVAFQSVTINILSRSLTITDKIADKRQLNQEKVNNAILKYAKDSSKSIIKNRNVLNILIKD